MKKIIFSVVLISQIAFSQTEKSVGDFVKVTAFDKIDVVLIPSFETKVLLNGSGSNEVELVNKNGELKIRLPLTKLLTGDNISATVYYKYIDAVEANEGSRIASETLVEATNFDIIAKEGSEIKLLLNVKRVAIKASQGSKIYLEGSASNQDIVISTGAILEAIKLTTEQTIITANTGAEASIYATEFVDAKVRAGGTISIFGKPKQSNKKTIVGGTITEY